MGARDGLLCTLGERKYAVDTEGINWATMRPTRQGVDQGAGAGEASLSNEVVWRRVRDNWVGGAGQEYADLTDEEDPSSDLRFHTSVNADPWTRRALTVGRPRKQFRAVTGTPRILSGQANSSGAFWVVDGANVAVYDADPLTGATAQLGGDLALAGGVPLDAATFGDEDLYVVNGDGSFGRVSYAGGGVTHAALGTEIGDMIAAAGTRLLAANGAELFELSNAGVKLTIYTHWSTSFRWGGAVAANNAIYAWGTVGGTGQIFQLPISDATGAVDPPIPAATLPVGEYVTELIVHVGAMVIGTNLGVRLASIEADGSITFGPVIDDLGKVHQLAAAGQYVYAASATAPHVWRLDPARFTDVLVPAFATESNELLDGSTVGALGVASVVRTAWGSDVATPVVGVVSATEASFYTRVSDGVARVSSQAEVDLGWFTFGIGELLSLDSVTVEVDPVTDGSQLVVRIFVDTPDEDAVIQGETDFADGTSELTVAASDDVRARRFRIRLVLGTDQALGTAPVVREVVLRAAPAPHLSDEMVIPVMLNGTVMSEFGAEVGMDVWGDWAYLHDLVQSRQRVPLVLGAFTATVRIEDIGVRSGGLGGGNGLDGWDRHSEWLKGTWDVRLVTVDTDDD